MKDAGLNIKTITIYMIQLHAVIARTKIVAEILSADINPLTFGHDKKQSNMNCEKCIEIYCPYRDEMARCYYENFVIPNDTKEFILQEPKVMKRAVIKEIIKDKESAMKFLKSAGIITDNGELHPRYK